jgi:hypothetical protein
MKNAKIKHYLKKDFLIADERRMLIINHAAYTHTI